MENWQDGKHVSTDLFTHIIETRAIKDIDQFIRPDWPGSLYSPNDLPDIERATDRIWRAITKREVIGIMGDYDMDGTPAAAVISQFLSLFGQEPQVILPTREEGYGFSEEAVNRFLAAGVSLIITVDSGIRDEKSVLLAKENRCDVIITDHHECPPTLPPALAVINPKRVDSRYPFTGLCGAAIAFKLVQALIATAPLELKEKIPKAFAEWLLDLVALATVADMVPLTSENRTLVYYGLKVIRRGARPGLRRLMQSLDLGIETLDTSDISYRLVPKCNACGRLDRMDEVYTLLIESNSDTIEMALQTILKRGGESQLLLANMLESAQTQLASQSSNSVIILADDAWHPGLTGLVAARLTESEKRPVAILAGVNNEYFRGSMRSIPGVNLMTLIASVSAHIEKFGGHEGAAGLTIRREKLNDLVGALSMQPINADATPKVTDGTISLDHISLESLERLSQLKPWGVDHPEPLWGVHNIQLQNTKWLSEGKHLRASIVSADRSLSVIYFNADSIRPFLGDSLDLCGTVSVNEFRGNRTPQFQLRSFRKSIKV